MIVLSFLVNKKPENTFVLAESEFKTLDDDIIEINVALYSTTPLGWDKKAPIWYIPILHNYTWTAGNNTYKFIVTNISDDDIINGNINIENFDLLLVPGGGVGDENAVTKGTLLNLRPNVVKWKNAISDFIKDGGGYVGHCGGSCIMCELEKKPESIIEKNYEKCTIGASNIKINFKNAANYFTAHFRINGYKYTGAANYMLWTAYSQNEYGYPHYNGLCFDVNINKSHPIFMDYPNDTLRIRWIRGPYFVLPEDPLFNVSTAASYPDEKVCDNASQRIHHWTYKGGILGLSIGLFRGLKYCLNNNVPLDEGAYAATEHAPDWDMLDEYVDLNQAGKPCIATEVYPNENEGRMVLSGLHPEVNVWWGGYIKEAEDTNNNFIAEPLFQLTDFIPFDETPEDEWTHTWGLVRREVAWAAKVPDSDLPPVFQ